MSAAQTRKSPGGAGPIATNQNTDASDFTAGADKRLANLRARAALTGATLYLIENDHGEPRYVVNRGQLTRELPDLDAVERWIDLAGVRS